MPITVEIVNTVNTVNTVNNVNTSSPSPHQRHQRRPTNNTRTRLNPLPAPQTHITLLTQKILSQQLHQPSKHQQPATDRIHAPDRQQSDPAGRVVQIMNGKADRLAERRRRAVRKRHEPRFRGRGREGQGGDAGAQGEALEDLMEGDGHEEDEKGRARRDGQGHADEDAVEEDAGFQE